ncbi:6119_t:CDS:2 [Gigaspora margarita]|uniref:6119_t:CDS:1 n=1 Tax=Gigaspora margarita TaxID=4874 RepID=A0ABN7UAQ6_GIGMA|nr:6119_t:CDS:2 [Gigaspora margarita]
MNEPIKFYHSNQPYYDEHLFQAAKFDDKNIIEEIRQAPYARKVFRLANSKDGKYKNQIKKGWHNISVETGEAELIEDSKILMEVRKEFQEEEKKKKSGRSGANEPQTPNGTGDTNINDNEEVKFLQHTLYHFAKLNENYLDKKYHNFPNDIFNLHKNGKFPELEDYRIEMVKEILTKIDSKKVNELKKQILAEFEKNNLISKIKEKELKKILEIEKGNNKDKSPNSDEPTKDSNEPNNNDEPNKPPANNNPNHNKNDNSPDQKPVINSPVDTRSITNSATVAEAYQQAKIQIIKLFQDNDIKPEIAQFAKRLQKAISEKKEKNNNKKSNLQPTKSNWEKFRQKFNLLPHKKLFAALFNNFKLQIVSGIIGIVSLAIIIFSINKKDNQPTTTPPIPNPSFQDESDDCPYNESSLTHFSERDYNMIAQKEELTK